MTAYIQPQKNSHKSASWNVARILLIGLVLLIALDLMFFFVQQAELRSELTEYYEEDSYYSRYYTQKEISEMIDEQLPDYSFSRVLGLLVKELPFVILLVYCLFFDNRYAGKFIYLLTTGICAWACGIVGIVLLIGADTPLSRAEGFLPVLYYLLVSLLVMGLGGMMLALFLGRLILPSDKLSSIATRLPFVLMGLLGALVILTLCQVEEFNATIIYTIFMLLVQGVFLYALYLLWQSESTRACRVIPRMHGAPELQQDLLTLAQQANNMSVDAAYEQQKASILKSFARLAPPAAYQSMLVKMPVPKAPVPAAKPTPAPASPAARPISAPVSASPAVKPAAAIPPATATPAAEKAPAAAVSAPAPKTTVAPAAAPTVAAPAPVANTAREKPAAEKVPAAPEKPTSWVCPSCSTRNPIAQETCYHCKTRKPSAAQASQAVSAKPLVPAGEPWVCPVCGTKNPLSQSVCDNCHEKRGHSGSWTCKNCNTQNPPHRGSCNQCGAYK